MVSHLGMLTGVVFLSFLVGLVLSIGILAAVLKAMSFRSPGFVSSKTQDAVKLRNPGGIRIAQERGEMARQAYREERAHGRRQ